MHVALKLLQLGGAPADPERQAYVRFAREAEAAGRLRHPNIVALFDAQPASGLFVFELMSGGTLADRLAANGPLSPAAGRRLALDLLAALGAAHERGIVHRDVKPANVFFDAAGNAKLGDFGGAHLVDFGQTQSGGFLGTLAYMSPEQISNAPIGAAADIYALGATLFEALVGRPPFLGPDLVGQHLGEAPPSAAALRPALTSLHDQVLARALAKVPADRFASAIEMAEAIAAWPVEAALAADGSDAPIDDERTPAPDGAGDGARRRRRRRRTRAVAHRRRPAVAAPRRAHRARRGGRAARRTAGRRRARRAAPAGGRRRTVRAARAAAVGRSPHDLVRGAAGRAAAPAGADRRRTRAARPRAGRAAARRRALVRPHDRRPGAAGRPRPGAALV